jgi:hypothetical protein
MDRIWIVIRNGGGKIKKIFLKICEPKVVGAIHKRLMSLFEESPPQKYY